MTQASGAIFREDLPVLVMDARAIIVLVDPTMPHVSDPRKRSCCLIEGQEVGLCHPPNRDHRGERSARVGQALDQARVAPDLP